MKKYVFMKEGTDMPRVPWIGVDLDRTLAEYHEWVSPTHVGKPIPKMVKRVIYWKTHGMCVKIMTARVNPSNPGAEVSKDSINKWLEEHIYPILKKYNDDPKFYTIPLTHEKDYDMTELWDDRAVQVVPNTGERADKEPEDYLDEYDFSDKDDE